MYDDISLNALLWIVGLSALFGFLVVTLLDFDFGGGRPTATELCAQNPAWTPVECYLLANGNLWIGMTDDQATASQGRPQKINRSVSANGTREQWVYEYGGRRYLYFLNGVLTSWQD